MLRVKHIASAFGFLLLASTAEARVLDYSDAQRLADEIVKDIKADEVLVSAVDAQLDGLGLYPAQKSHLRKALFVRLMTEARNAALAKEGDSYPDREAAMEALRKQIRVFRFNALSDPKGYANGRKTAFRVTTEEAQRMSRGLLATYFEREMPLRERLDEMVTLEEIERPDIASLRALAREACLERGRNALREMVGMSFFSAVDAQLFLEYEIEAEIDSIRGDRLGDPLTRSGFVQEARERFPHGAATTETGFNGAREETSSGRVAARRTSGSARGMQR